MITRVHLLFTFAVVVFACPALAVPSKEAHWRKVETLYNHAREALAAERAAIGDEERSTARRHAFEEALCELESYETSWVKPGEVTPILLVYLHAYYAYALNALRNAQVFYKACLAHPGAKDPSPFGGVSFFDLCAAEQKLVAQEGVRHEGRSERFDIHMKGAIGSYAVVLGEVALPLQRTPAQELELARRRTLAADMALARERGEAALRRCQGIPTPEIIEKPEHAMLLFGIGGSKEGPLRRLLPVHQRRRQPACQWRPRRHRRRPLRVCATSAPGCR